VTSRLAKMGGVAALCSLVLTGVTDARDENQASSLTAVLLEGYRDHAALLGAARSLVGPNAEVVRIGASREGRELIALRLGAGDTTGRPAILITAGLDGQHLVGAEVALRVARELLSEETLAKHPDLLSKVTLWVIPCANPDALEATLRGPLAQRGALRPVDDDRDGAIDEDGPLDLDGDGVIVEMRVKNPAPPYVATLVLDAADPRLLRTPETGLSAKPFEAPQYAVFTEGDDVDGDGRIGEDGPGEVDLNRNFPHRYPEFSRDAGPHQLSEPETKALVDFVLAHPEFVAAITYGRHDSLVKAPEGRDNDATGRTPLVHGGADVDLYQAIGKLYRDTTGQSRSGSAEHDGSFWLWLANHRGLLSVACTAWGRPDLPPPPESKPTSPPQPAPEVPAAKPPTDPLTAPVAEPPPTPPILRVALGMLHDPADDEVHPAGLQTVPAPSPTASPSPTPNPQERPPGGRGRRGGGGGGNFQARGGPPPAQASATSDPESGEWLAYNDKVRNGIGFIAWHEVAHPIFSVVEVGGFHPLFRLTPPSAELDALAAKQTAFVLELIDRLPSLVVAKPTVSTLGPELFRIETAITNAGRLPTMPAMGVTTRARSPVIARVSTDVDRIVSGDRVRKIDSLGPGARVALEWIVRAAPDEVVELSIGSTEYGISTYRVRNGALLEESQP
jgi:Zinc carboxypeptidase